MGFHLRDPDAGTVTGQFPQGYPVWIAIAYGLDGVTGTRRVIAWWAILGVLAVYFAGKPPDRTASGGRGGRPAVRPRHTDVVRALPEFRDRHAGAAVCRAACARLRARRRGSVLRARRGLAARPRLVHAISGRAGCRRRRRRVAARPRERPSRARRVPCHDDGMGCRRRHVLHDATAAVLRPACRVRAIARADPPRGASRSAVPAVCALIWASRRPRVSAATRTFLPLALIAIVTVGGIYALFFREPGGRLAPHDAHAVRIFADLYFTPVAFGLALAGYALVVWRSFWRAPALILMITALSIFFFYKMRIWPEHFWLARRFLTEILPGALIFASAAMFAPVWMHEVRIRFAEPVESRLHGNRRHCHRAARLPIPVCIVADSRHMSSTPGVIPRLERLASRFSDNDLVVVEARAASDLHALALPLSYIYARNVLVLSDSRPDKHAVREFLTWAHERYEQRVFPRRAAARICCRQASAPSLSRRSDFRCRSTRRPPTTFILAGQS